MFCLLSVASRTVYLAGGHLDLGHLCPRVVFLKYPQGPCIGSRGGGGRCLLKMQILKPYSTAVELSSLTYGTRVSVF